MKVLRCFNGRTEETTDVVSLSEGQVITGAKNFTGGLQYNGNQVATLLDVAALNIDGGTPASMFTNEQNYDCGGI